MRMPSLDHIVDIGSSSNVILIVAARYITSACLLTYSRGMPVTLGCMTESTLPYVCLETAAVPA